MGSYTFTWEHSANEVFVTGTFDDWGRTVKLEKEGDIFKKTVELPKKKVEYKFVVDGNWVTNESAPGEFDGPNYNNILLPEDIKEAPVHTLSSAAPTSSTAAMAGAVPKEENESSPVPGAFPETPANEPNAFSVNPIPASETLGNPIHLAPGEKVPDPSTFTNNTIQSTVKGVEPEEEPSFGVNPIPASSGAGNPIQLAAGEKVPDLSSTTAPSTEGGMFGVPPIGGTMIPESSLPMGGEAVEKDPGVTIQSAHPLSSTAALAGAVPLEPKVPAVVSESQKEAHFAPEASANAEAVEEKKDVEAELKSKVPEEPAAAESTSGVGKAAEVAGGVAAGGAAAFAAATYSAKDTAARIVGANGSPDAATTTTSEVPEVVTESQQKAHVEPEAAANPVAVEEKKEVEQELLKEIKTTDATGEPAPTVTAATTETAPAPTAPVATLAAPATPSKGTDSRDVSPMSKPVTAEASTPAAAAAPETPKKTVAPASASGTPESVASNTTAEKKKKNRLSFFGKLKQKLHDKSDKK